jgi:hypothetical protein
MSINYKILSNQKAALKKIGYSSAIIPATWEAELGKIKVQGQPRQKVSKLTLLSISTNKLGMVVPCLSSQLSGRPLVGRLRFRPAWAKT